MPLAVTHVILTIIAVDIWRDYFSKHKRYVTMYTLFIAGVGGLLPDLDVPFNMAANWMGITLPKLLHHGGITHTPLFALLFFIPGYFLWKKRKHRMAMYFYVVSFGILFHIFLDWFLGGGSYEGIMWLFPFSLQGFKLHLLLLVGGGNVPSALDAIILLFWLWHEEVKHKITDFI